MPPQVRDGEIHINGTESMWALLKRGIHSTWHHVSVKHLARYANECTFRLNEGNVENHTLDRLESFASRAFQHRIHIPEAYGMSPKVPPELDRVTDQVLPAAFQRPLVLRFLIARRIR